MNTASRPWLSQFDLDYYEYEEHRERYQGIQPDHARDKWKVEYKGKGKKLRGDADTLAKAVDMVRRFKRG